MSEPTPEPSPEQDARVRRLLAEARHAEPVPADVADRLDAVLADLSRERSDAAPSTTDRSTTPGPVDLAARRRRRVGRVLVAAAAVVVVGLGAGRFVEGLVQGGESSVGSSGSTADSAGSGAESIGAPPVGPRQQRAYAAARVPRVHPATFTADVTRVRRLSLESHDHAVLAALAGKAVRACAPVRAGTGRQVPVRYAGQPAVLVLRPAAGGSQVADLYLCGADAVARSVTLPAP